MRTDVLDEILVPASGDLLLVVSAKEVEPLRRQAHDHPSRNERLELLAVAGERRKARKNRTESMLCPFGVHRLECLLGSSFPGVGTRVVPELYIETEGGKE